MDLDLGREYGEQPISQRMQELGLTNHDLVEKSTEQLTHKMVTKAKSGRWLSMRVRLKVQNAFNKASGQNLTLADLFNYS